MKRTALTKLILASLVTSGLSAAAHADDKATFDAQLTVSSVNKCKFTVTRENGTEMSATYTYTQADQQAGTFGTTVLNTTAPLTVLVSSGDDSCPLGQFTVATNNPGVKIAKNVAGIPTHDGGYWPVKWVYAGFDAYSDVKGTSAITATTTNMTADTNSGNIWTLSSRTGSADKGGPLNGWWVVPDTANATEKYGDYENGDIPGLSSSSSGGHINCTTTYGVRSVSGVNSCGTGLAGVSAYNDDPIKAVPFTVTPASGASAVRISLAQIIATFPYGKTTQAPDPLTVYDTLTGGGAPLSGSGMMTITAL